MKKVIKHLQTLLPCDQFIVTGSTALHYMGLVDKPSDLDIILINPTDEAKNILERLQRDNPAKTKPISGGNVSYIFMQDEIKVDIFIEKANINTELNIDGVLLNRIDRIIDRKKSAGRLKDWMQLRFLSRKFYQESDFEKHISSKEYAEIK